MEIELPKRLLREGYEPQSDKIKINNSCRMPMLDRLKDTLPKEYTKVMSDSVFANVFAIHENGLHFSGRVVHAMLCRQLVTKKKHELWFVFGKKPLRFSMQEFYAITGLKFKDDRSSDLEKWTDDYGFWSKLLKRKEHICLKKLLDVYLVEARDWKLEDDRLRLVYLCVIAGLVMAIDEKAIIPLSYVQLVMDFEKVRTYPWGLVAFDLLVDTIVKRRDKLKQQSYSLHGFTYAFLIWAMEAVPGIGDLLGKKISNELTEAPRCSNWSGAAKVMFDDINCLEVQPTDVVYPYISSIENYDLCESAEFLRDDEIKDLEVDKLKALVKSNYDFTHHIWASLEDDVAENDNIQNSEEKDYARGESEVPQDEHEVAQVDKVELSTSKNRKKRQADIGAETRKRKLLCQRVATTHGYSVKETLNEEMKSFFTGLFDSFFKSFMDNIGTQLETFKRQIVTRLDKLEGEVSGIKELISTSGVTSKQPQVQSKYGENNFLYDGIFSEPEDVDLNMNTQEFLQEKIGHLSQKSVVPEVDPILNLFGKKVDMRPIKQESGSNVEDSGNVNCKRVHEPEKDKDAVLVYVSDEKWESFQEWCNKKENINLGPTKLDDALWKRIMGCVWLGNEEIDAMMYIFRENTSLGRYKEDRVGFMDCLFSTKLQGEHAKYMANKKQHSRSTHILAYANGELPAHGKTGKKWGLNFDRIYAPIFVNGNHWISVCVNFLLRTVEVFDCYRHVNRRHVESFAITIPRILKEIGVKVNGKTPLLTPYEIIEDPLPSRLNKSACDCGVYALKYIECHFLHLGMDLITDDNIGEARHKIAVDLWEAANDHVLIDRMKKFEPPKMSSDSVVID